MEGWHKMSRCISLQKESETEPGRKTVTEMREHDTLFRLKSRARPATRYAEAQKRPFCDVTTAFAYTVGVAFSVELLEGSIPRYAT